LHEKSRFLHGSIKSVTTSLAQQKQIFLATHPAINQLSQVMSVFGRTAHAAMSVVNTLNLANIAFQGSSRLVVDAQKELADAQLELINAYASGDPLKIADAQKRLGDAIENLRDTTKAATDQQRQNWIALGATTIFTASAMTQALVQLAATSKGAAALAGAAWALVFVGAIYGALLAVAALSPQFAEQFAAIIDDIKSRYDVDGLTAFLMSPWEAMRIDLTLLWFNMAKGFTDLINTWITGVNFLRSLVGLELFDMLKAPAYPADLARINLGHISGGAAPGGKPTGFAKLMESITSGPEMSDFLSSQNKQYEALLKNAEKQFQNTAVTDANTQGLQANEEVMKFMNDALKVGTDATLQAEQTTSLATNAISNLTTEVKTLNTKGISIAGKASGGIGAGGGFYNDLSFAQAYEAGKGLDLSGKRLRAASGFEGIVTGMTPILAGEAGPEHVKITPLSQMSKTGGTTVVLYMTVQGSIHATRDIEKIAMDGLKKGLKAVGNY